MKKNIYSILSFFLFLAGASALLYGTYIFLNPKYTVTVQKIVPPSPILTSWQKDFICSRTEPTPLFLNFYGNYREQWIMILFGRDKEVGRVVLYPAVRVNGERQNISRYSVTAGGKLKDEYELDKTEKAEHMKNLTLSLDEEKFLRNCLAQAEMLKFEI